MDSAERAELEERSAALARRIPGIRQEIDEAQRELYDVERRIHEIRQTLRTDDRERNRVGPLPDYVHIGDLELAVRTENTLLRVGITTLGQLCASTERELLHVPGFGRKQLDDVKEALDSRSMALRVS